MKKPTVGETQMTTIILQTDEEKQLWKSVAAAVASASNATDKSSMCSWADRAVEYYRARLPVPTLQEGQ